MSYKIPAFMSASFALVAINFADIAIRNHHLRSQDISQTVAIADSQTPFEKVVTQTEPLLEAYFDANPRNPATQNLHRRYGNPATHAKRKLEAIAYDYETGKINQESFVTSTREVQDIFKYEIQEISKKITPIPTIFGLIGLGTATAASIVAGSMSRKYYTLANRFKQYHDTVYVPKLHPKLQ